MPFAVLLDPFVAEYADNYYSSCLLHVTAASKFVALDRDVSYIHNLVVVRKEKACLAACKMASVQSLPEDILFPYDVVGVGEVLPLFFADYFAGSRTEALVEEEEENIFPRVRRRKVLENQIYLKKKERSEAS